MRETVEIIRCQQKHDRQQRLHGDRCAMPKSETKSVRTEAKEVKMSDKYFTCEAINVKNRQQAKDALWVEPETMTEVLLQDELKKIHTAIGNSFKRGCER